jgi:hypothetical protein
MRTPRQKKSNQTIESIEPSLKIVESSAQLQPQTVQPRLFRIAESAQYLSCTVWLSGH